MCEKERVCVRVRQTDRQTEKKREKEREKKRERENSTQNSKLYYPRTETAFRRWLILVKLQRRAHTQND